MSCSYLKSVDGMCECTGCREGLHHAKYQVAELYPALCPILPHACFPAPSTAKPHLIVGKGNVNWIRDAQQKAPGKGNAQVFGTKIMLSLQPGQKL